MPIKLTGLPVGTYELVQVNPPGVPYRKLSCALGMKVWVRKVPLEPCPLL